MSDYSRRDNPVYDIFDCIFKLAEIGLWLGMVFYVLMWIVGILLGVAAIGGIIYLCQHLTLGWS